MWKGFTPISCTDSQQWRKQLTPKIKALRFDHFTQTYDFLDVVQTISRPAPIQKIERAIKLELEQYGLNFGRPKMSILGRKVQNSVTMMSVRKASITTFAIESDYIGNTSEDKSFMSTHLRRD